MKIKEFGDSRAGVRKLEALKIRSLEKSQEFSKVTGFVESLVRKLENLKIRRAANYTLERSEI